MIYFAFLIATAVAYFYAGHLILVIAAIVTGIMTARSTASAIALSVAELKARGLPWVMKRVLLLRAKYLFVCLGCGMTWVNERGLKCRRPHRMLFSAAVLLLSLLFPNPGHSQTTQQTFRDSSGREVGRSSTDTRGNVTYYDAMGRNTGRSVTNGNTTTTYDNMGRRTGSISRCSK